jgi:hypothetical protein
MLNFEQFEFVDAGTGTAGPSTTLRSSRDDKFVFQICQGTAVTEWIGGADRDRTGDPLLAKQVLSQLSYSPLTFNGGPG